LSLTQLIFLTKIQTHFKVIFSYFINTQNVSTLTMTITRKTVSLSYNLPLFIFFVKLIFYIK